MTHTFTHTRLCVCVSVCSVPAEYITEEELRDTKPYLKTGWPPASADNNRSSSSSRHNNNRNTADTPTAAEGKRNRNAPSLPRKADKQRGGGRPTTPDHLAADDPEGWEDEMEREKKREEARQPTFCFS